MSRAVLLVLSIDYFMRRWQNDRIIHKMERAIQKLEELPESWLKVEMMGGLPREELVARLQNTIAYYKINQDTPLSKSVVETLCK